MLYQLELLVTTVADSDIHRFVGEETYSKGSSRDYCIGDEPTWCVDPLDGTVVR